MGTSSDRGTGFGLPPPDTGNFLLNGIARLLLFLIHLERRFDPFFRPVFDRLFRDRLARLITAIMNKRRQDEGLGLAEEKAQPDEEAHLDDIITTFTAQMKRLWNPGYVERGGNTKTHGIVRAELTVRDDLPENMRRGIFAEPRSYRAWVRFSGPGPYVTPDIDDVGFMSMSIKLMGVPGPKLLDDEKFTQDLLGVSTPTFVTPNTRANARLQHWSYKNAPTFYFANFRDPHILDSIMQLLWTKTQTSPLERRVLQLRSLPARRGAGDAVLLPFTARDEDPRAAPAASSRRTTISATPWWRRWPSKTSSSTSRSSCKPIRS